jgi:hypothetical protein
MACIHTVAHAQEAIEAVVTWLTTYREPLTIADVRRCWPAVTEEEILHASVYPLGVVGREGSACLARQWSDRLLEASTAKSVDGDGCPLCLQ